MRLSYQTLFTVQISHPYYANGQCRDVTMSPTRFTGALMRGNGMLWRSDVNSNVMLIGENNKENRTIHLYFLLQSKNSYLRNFTDFPLTQPLQKIYLHNFSEKDPGSRTHTLSSSYWTPSEPHGLRDYHTPDHVIQEVKPEHLGIVDLQLNLASGNTSFEILLSPRSTIWRYWLVNRNDTTFDEIEVRETRSNNLLSFQMGSPRILANGEPAVPLVIQNNNPDSAAGQVCSERHHLRPVLHITQKQNGNATKKIVMNLPTPDYRQINTESTDSGLQLFSDMYVYFFKPNFF